MGSHSLPSPPAEEHKSGAPKKSSCGSKSAKSTGRVSKRAIGAAHHHHDHLANVVGTDGRQKRVWKACERCRMKKTKCDGEFPCKRCKDDGLVCTAGVRKKVEYKQLPRGYAEVLENTQFALITTVHKLYSMVRNSQPWELGEPDLNDRGLPVIHDIAQKLGCIRPNSYVDLPVHSVFPEDEAGMTELARQLEEQQSKEGGSESHQDVKDDFSYMDRASPSELDQSDFEDYRKAAFGGNGSGSTSNGMTLSPQSFAGSNDFDFSPTIPDLDPGVMFASQAHAIPPYPAWTLPKPQTDALSMHFMHQADHLEHIHLMSPGLMEADYGTVKPGIMSCSNPDIMMSMGDPMFYSGFDSDGMRL
ncbi:hypothetical protein E4U19_007060 [Claviceps sp. Clav32 group G5]|nr:hypothetical protein E4U19_007060 [Claviceps sp. Clav32 group G5]KAG6047831.1 hypothetical protein E4U39_008011 [Claviceps sp. Clav50 group G5]